MKDLQTFFSEFVGKRDAELQELTFVLVGDFCSHLINLGEASHLTDLRTAGKNEFQSLLDGFAAMLHVHAPTVAQHAHFIFVPGPNDPAGLIGTMPQPPIPAAFTSLLRQRVRRCTFAPNPCRLRFFTQEILVARLNASHDLQAKAFRSSTTTFPGRAFAEEAVPYERIVRTIVDQAHLAGQCSTGILWKYDALLRLAPLPQMLVLCDRTEQWTCTALGMKVVNPGPFAVGKTFLWCTPCDGDFTVNSIAPLVD